MFTFHEKDNHKIANPAKMHLPIPSEVTQSQIFDLPEVRATEVLPTHAILTTDGSKFIEIARSRFTRNIRESIQSPHQNQ